MLTIGDRFPSYSLTSVESSDISNAFQTVTESSAPGKWKVYFFYPKDFTFVCPTELSGFDDLNDERTTSIDHLLEVCQIESGRNIVKGFFRQPQLHDTGHLDQLLIDKALAIFDDLRRLRHQ